MAALLQTMPPLIVVYAVLVLLRRYCGCCPAMDEQEEAPADEDMDAERAREIEAFLSKPDKNIFTDSVMKENEKQYGLVLQGMTTTKLTTNMEETNIL